jgi:hypothetical protein
MGTSYPFDVQIGPSGRKPVTLFHLAFLCDLNLPRSQSGLASDGQGMLRARKFVPPTFCEITSSRFGHRALLATLRSGFLVEACTPAAKLLDRLVQEGFATRRWANRRDLH